MFLYLHFALFVFVCYGVWKGGGDEIFARYRAIFVFLFVFLCFASFVFVCYSVGKGGEMRYLRDIGPLGDNERSVLPPHLESWGPHFDSTTSGKGHP